VSEIQIEEIFPVRAKCLRHDEVHVVGVRVGRQEQLLAIFAQFKQGRAQIRLTHDVLRGVFDYFGEEFAILMQAEDLLVRVVLILAAA